MKPAPAFLLCVLLLVFLSACAPSPTATPISTTMALPTATPLPTITLTPTATATTTATTAPINRPSPSATVVAIASLPTIEAEHLLPTPRAIGYQFPIYNPSSANPGDTILAQSVIDAMRKGTFKGGALAWINGQWMFVPLGVVIPTPGSTTTYTPIRSQAKSTTSPTSISTASAIIFRQQAHLKDTAELYVGPDLLMYDTIAVLPKDTSVTLRGAFADYVKVETQISNTITGGYLPSSVIDVIPPGMPGVSIDQLPWITSTYIDHDSAKLLTNTPIYPAWVILHAGTENEVSVQFSFEGGGQADRGGSLDLMSCTSRNFRLQLAFTQSTWYLSQWGSNGLNARLQSNDRTLRLSLRISADGKTLTVIFPDKQEKTFATVLPAYWDGDLCIAAHTLISVKTSLVELSSKTLPDGKYTPILMASNPARVKMPWGDKTGNDAYFDFGKVTPEQTQQLVTDIFGHIGETSPSTEFKSQYKIDHGDPFDPLGFFPKMGLLLKGDEVPYWYQEKPVVGMYKKVSTTGTGYTGMPDLNIYNFQVAAISNKVEKILGQDLFLIKLKDKRGREDFIYLRTKTPVIVSLANAPINTSPFPDGHYKSPTDFAQVTDQLDPGMFKKGMIVGLNVPQDTKDLADIKSKNSVWGVVFYVTPYEP